MTTKKPSPDDPPTTLLRRAKKVLKERGLNKGGFVNSKTGCVCVWGALGIAAGEAPGELPLTDEFGKALEALADCTVTATNGLLRHPPTYNDLESTTEEDIQKLLNCAIKRVKE